MIFSDINLNEQTAFLTKKITLIEDEHSNFTSTAKKILFFKEILNSKDPDEKILDNFEYARTSYKVSWEQMIETAQSAFRKSVLRVDNVRTFLINNPKIECKFFISKRKINDEEDGYLKQIKDKMSSDMISPHRISYKSTGKHFDGISNAMISESNFFFRKNNQFI